MVLLLAVRRSLRTPRGGPADDAREGRAPPWDFGPAASREASWVGPAPDVSRRRMLAGLRARERAGCPAPTVHRFPAQGGPVRLRGGRSRLPLRGSPGFTPGSLVGRERSLAAPARRATYGSAPLPVNPRWEDGCVERPRPSSPGVACGLTPVRSL